MAADLAAGPLPVVVFASGVNCSQDAYRWLAIELVRPASSSSPTTTSASSPRATSASRPASTSARCRPDAYGTRPTCDVFAAGARHRSRGSTPTAAFAGLFDLTGSRSAATPPAAPSRCSRPAARSSRACARCSPTPATPSRRACCACTRPAPCSRPRPTSPSLLMSGEEDGVFKASAGKYGAARRGPRHRDLRAGRPAARSRRPVLARPVQGREPLRDRHPRGPDRRARLPRRRRRPCRRRQTRETLVALVTDFLRSALHRRRVRARQARRPRGGPASHDLADPPPLTSPRTAPTPHHAHAHRTTPHDPQHEPRPSRTARTDEEWGSSRC